MFYVLWLLKALHFKRSIRKEPNYLLFLHHKFYQYRCRCPTKHRVSHPKCSMLKLITCNIAFIACYRYITERVLPMASTENDVINCEWYSNMLWAIFIVLILKSFNVLITKYYFCSLLLICATKLKEVMKWCKWTIKQW